MANKRVGVTLDINADISQVRTAATEMQKIFSSMNLDGKNSAGITKLISNLDKALIELEQKSNTALSGLGDSNAVEKSIGKVNGIINSLLQEFQLLGKNAPKDLAAAVQGFSDKMAQATQFQKDYAAAIKKTESEAKDLGKAQTDAIDKVDAAQKKYDATLTKQLQKEKEIADLRKQVEDRNKSKDLGILRKNQLNYQQQIEDAKSAIKQIAQEYENIRINKSGLINGQDIEKLSADDLELYRVYAAQLESMGPAAQEAKKALEDYNAETARISKSADSSQKDLDKINDTLSTQASELDGAKDKLKKATEAINQFNEAGKKADAFDELKNKLAGLFGDDSLKNVKNIDELKNALEQLATTAGGDVASKIRQAISALGQTEGPLNRSAAAARKTGESFKKMSEAEQEINHLTSRLKYFFSLAGGFQLMRRAIRSAVDTTKELDAVMTQTAVVSDYSVGDMWKTLPQYSKYAKQLGAEIKDVYSAQTLYVQQGLNMNDAMDLGIETLKMARVAGIDAAEATNSMTAALRGFNMELTETSAVRINDVYSKLAQNTASNVQEISTAMSKVAALANSANMSFENTSAFLATIIESTREGAETAGTALKTVIARFTEVKKLYDQGELTGTDEEGQEVDVNKISKALRTAGINMNDFFTGAKGLDEIFMELGSKWDSLTTVQQRYIATMAAGSRQQSRFLALMQNYSRTVELTTMAYNSAGSGQEQFEKTLDSLEAKLNQLKAAWDTFTMGIANSDFIKGVIDVGTQILETINKIINAISGGSGAVKSVLSLAAAFGAFKIGGAIFKGGLGKIGQMISMGAKKGVEEPQNIAQRYQQVKIRARNRITDTKEGFQYSFFNKNGKANRQAIIDAENNAKQMAQAAKKAYDTEVDKLNQLKSKGFTADEIKAAGGQKQAKEKRAQEIAVQEQEVQNKENELNAANQTVNTTAQNSTKAIQQYGAAMQAAGVAAGVLAGLLTLVANKLEETGNSKAAGVIKGIATGFGVLSTALTLCGTMFMAFGAAAEAGSAMATAAIESIPFIGWAAAIISALVAVISIISSLVETSEEKAERLKKAAEETAEGVKKVKSDYEDLMSKIDSINKAESGLDELVTGTEEWDTAVQNLNQSILELLTLYPELAGAVKWVNDHLELDVQSEFYKSWLQQQQENIKNGTVVTATGNIVKQRAESEAKVTKDSGFTRGYYTRGDIGQFYDWISQGFYKSYSAYGKDIGSFLRSKNPAKSKELLSSEQLTTLYSDFINQVYPLVINGTIQTTGNFGSAFQSFIKNYKIGDNQLTQEQQEDALNLFSKAWTLEEDSNSYKWLTDFLGGVREYQQTNVDKIREQMGPSILAAFSESKYAKMDSVYANAYKNFALRDFSGAYTSYWSESKDIKDYIKEPGNREKYRQAAGLEKVEDIDEDLFKEYAKAQVVLDSFFNLSTDNWHHGMDYLEKYLNSLDSFNKDIAAKLISDDIGSLTKDEYKALAENKVDLGEVFSNFSSIDISSFADTYEKFFDGLRQTDRQAVEGFSETIGQIERFSKITKQVEKNGGDIEKIFSIFDNTFKGIDSKKVSQAKEILSTYDFTDRTSIREAIKELNKLGIDIDSNITQQIINVSKAIAKFNLKNLEEQIKTLESSKTAAKKISEGETTVSAEEYRGLSEVLPQGLFKAEDWVRTGLDEYTYIGEETNSLLASIDAAVGQLVTENIKQTEEDIFKGQQIESVLEDKIYRGRGDEGITVNKAIEMLTENPESLNQAALSGLRIKFGLAPNTNVEGILDYYNKYYGLEGIALQGNQEKIAGLQTYAEVGYNQSSAQYLLNQAATGNESASRALEAQAVNDDLLLKVEDYGKKLQLTTEQANEHKDALNALAITANKTEKNIDNLNEALSKDFQTLKDAKKGTAAYNAAMTNILKTAKKVFGNDITSEWVEQHIDDFEDLAKGGDEAQAAFERLSKIKADEVLKKIGNEGILTGDILNTVRAHWNELNGSTLEVGGTADFSDILSGMEVTEEQADALSAYLNSIPGISAVWEPGPDGEVGPNGEIPVKTGRLKITKTGASGSGFSGGGGGGGGGGGEEFKNDFDKYYNMVEDINELERLRNLLETDYNQLLESEAASGKAIYDNLKRQVDLLKERRDITADLAEKRKGQIFDLLNDEEYKDVKQYAWWNEEDQTIEIDWDAINKIKDSETGDKVKELVQKLEDFQSKYDEQIEALEDIESTLQEIEKRGRDQYTSLEDRVRDALIQQIQTQIDELTAVNEGISDANQKLFDSIQSTLELQRQERDNAKTEEELGDKEQRLAYLQQDSSGANAVEIAQLQKELEDARESYTDQLIDQKISELQKQNDEAAEQRQEQIDLLQQSLDWQEKNGEFWEQAYQLMNNGIGPDGTLVTGSELEQLLKQGEGWQALSQEGKMNWLSELETMVAEAVGYLYLSRQLEKIGTKAGTEITFTDAEGNTHTGKVDKDGNVVIDNGDGTQTVWKDVYQSYDGSYRTLETEENAKTENKPATSTGSGGSGGTGGSGGNKDDDVYSYNVVTNNGEATVQKVKGNGGKYATEKEAKDAAANMNSWTVGKTTRSVAGDPGNEVVVAYVKKAGAGNGKIKPYIQQLVDEFNKAPQTMKFATGGLADYTGPAWLDGTKSHPELVLNARDTENFIQLKDTLADLRKNSASLGTNGDNYYEISINVDEIGSDYDVDKLADRLRTLIYRDSQYRNVNTLNRLR